MPNNPLDLLGKQFGQYKVIKLLPYKRNGSLVWLLRCEDCGFEVDKISYYAQRSNKCGKCGHRKNYTGHRVNHLTVENFSYKKRQGDQYRNFWNVRCDCGNLVILPVTSFTGRKAQKTCGDWQNCRFASSRLPDDELAKARMLINYKSGAKERHLGWDLTDETAWLLMNQNCHWCGIAPQPRRFESYKVRTIMYNVNGIDRVDNRKGYIASNSVPCCFQCNRSKGKLSSKVFLSQVKAIAKHQSGILSEITED